MTKTALYRHFDNANRLLYVGISLCAFTRTRQHGMSKPWFYDVAHIEIEWFETRSAAESAEWQAIRNEKPLHNQTFNRKARAPDEAIVVYDENLERVPEAYRVPRKQTKRDRIDLAKVRARGELRRVVSSSCA